MRLNSRIQQKQDTAANWKNNNPVLLSGEFGYETDTGKVKIGNGSSHWNDIDYVGKDELPTDPTFNSLTVGGGDSSASGFANLVADNAGVTITKDDSVIDINAGGVDVQSTNIHLAADNGTLSITAGSWPVLTIDNSSEWNSKVNMLVGDFNLTATGMSGSSSLYFGGGLDLSSHIANFDFSEFNINSATTFLYTPCVSNGSDGKIELVDKNYLEERLSSIAPSESANFKSLTVGGNDDPSGSGSQSADGYFVVDDLGITASKGESAIDINDEGIQIESTNTNFSIAEGVTGSFSITSGSWPTLVVNTNGWTSEVSMNTSNFSLNDQGWNGSSIAFWNGVDVYADTLDLETGYGLDISGLVTFDRTPVVNNGSFSVELATKDDLANVGGYAEIIDLLD